jgi:hypothetical protein
MAKYMGQSDSLIEQNYIFPTRQAAAIYVSTHPASMDFVEFNLDERTPEMFPVRIGHFSSLNEARHYARIEQSETRPEQMHENEEEIKYFNEIYILHGWLFDTDTKVWRIARSNYVNAMAAIKDRKANVERGQRAGIGAAGGWNERGIGAEAGIGAAGGWNERGIGAAAGIGRGAGGRHFRVEAVSGRGRLSTTTALPTNIRDILTESDEKKLQLINREVHVLSGGGIKFGGYTRVFFDTDSIISKLSEIIKEDGIREWEKLERNDASNKGEKVQKLKGTLVKITQNEDEALRTYHNRTVPAEAKLGLAVTLKHIPKKRKLTVNQVKGLFAQHLDGSKFEDIDKEIQSLSTVMINAIELIEEEEKQKGEKLTYTERAVLCNKNGINIHEFEKIIHKLSIMIASYKPTNLVQASRTVTKSKMEEYIALLDLLRLMLIYSNTELGDSFSHLNMSRPMEVLYDLATYDTGFRRNLYRGKLSNHGIIGAPIEMAQRSLSMLGELVGKSILGAASVIVQQDAPGGMHGAVMSELIPLSQQAGNIVINRIASYIDSLTQKRVPITRRLTANRRRNIALANGGGGRNIALANGGGGRNIALANGGGGRNIALANGGGGGINREQLHNFEAAPNQEGVLNIGGRNEGEDAESALSNVNSELGRLLNQEQLTPASSNSNSNRTLIESFNNESNNESNNQGGSRNSARAGSKNKKNKSKSKSNSNNESNSNSNNSQGGRRSQYRRKNNNSNSNSE